MELSGRRKRRNNSYGHFGIGVFNSDDALSYTGLVQSVEDQSRNQMIHHTAPK